MSKKFDIHEWQAKQRQAKQRLLNEERSQESMSNTDIKALQKLAGEYSLNKILNTIAAIADKIGKHEQYCSPHAGCMFGGRGLYVALELGTIMADKLI